MVRALRVWRLGPRVVLRPYPMISGEAHVPRSPLLSGDPGTDVGQASTLRNLSAREEEATPAPAGSAMARSVGERVAASHLSTVQLPLCMLAIPAQAAIPLGGPPLWVGVRGEGR